MYLTEKQKELILKYVDDKTYSGRISFIIGIVITIIGIIIVPNYDMTDEGFITGLMCLINGILLSVATFKYVLKFRNTKNQLDIALSQFRKLNNYIEKQKERTMLSKSQINSGRNRNNINLTPMKQLISKYYLIDDYNNQYECISYLDYKKCIEKGEFISVDFPTGEKFALYE